MGVILTGTWTIFRRDALGIALIETMTIRMTDTEMEIVFGRVGMAVGRVSVVSMIGMISIESRVVRMAIARLWVIVGKMVGVGMADSRWRVLTDDRGTKVRMFDSRWRVLADDRRVRVGMGNSRWRVLADDRRTSVGMADSRWRVLADDRRASVGMGNSRWRILADDRRTSVGMADSRWRWR